MHDFVIYISTITNILNTKRQFTNLLICLGCVYGKGNQYTGKANVTISGNECLSWADKRIVHQLRINVDMSLYIYTLKICY